MGTPGNISIPLSAERGKTEPGRPRIEGLHHVTAMAGEPQPNIDFYTGVLGLRLVKLTVNFDDPTTYHLYYGDGQDHPGTILTFFPWPGAYPGGIGTGQLTVTSFAVPEKSLPYWRERLRKREVVTNRRRPVEWTSEGRCGARQGNASWLQITWLGVLVSRPPRRVATLSGET